MKPKMPLRRALTHPDALGPILGGDSWEIWRVILMAVMGEKLTDEERAVYSYFTGRDQAPSEPVDETWIVAGRRGGKTRAMSALAIYLAGLCDWSDHLARGEKGVVLLIAPDVRQAKVALDYAESCINETPIMKQLHGGRTAETLTLTTGISIEVRSASFRRIRGMTCVAILADECCFWLSDEGSANPDTEIINAARPALATTQGPLIAISSPYARRGAMYDMYRRHYGPDGDPRVLVAKGASRDFNPSLPQSVVDRAMERDEAAARAEYLGEFRSDIEQFLTREAIEACVIPDRRELPPVRQYRYTCFIDPSGGSADSMTCAIAHREADTLIVDAIRETKPPFSPEAVVEQYADLAKSYRCTKVIGDHYGGEFAREPFRRHGLNYEVATMSKSQLYGELLPQVNSRMVDLLQNDRLINQLAGLERRVNRGGRESIDHRSGSHDDVANAVAGAVVFASRTPNQYVQRRSPPKAILAYQSAKRNHGQLSRRDRERVHKLEHRR